MSRKGSIFTVVMIAVLFTTGFVLWFKSNPAQASPLAAAQDKYGQDPYPPPKPSDTPTEPFKPSDTPTEPFKPSDTPTVPGIPTFIPTYQYTLYPTYLPRPTRPFPQPTVPYSRPRPGGPGNLPILGIAVIFIFSFIVLLKVVFRNKTTGN